MLQIAKYYINLFGLIIQNNFAAEETKSVLDNFDESSNKDDFLKQNAEAIIAYLDNLDWNNNSTLSINEDLSIDWSNVNQLQDLLKQIWVTWDLSSWINLAEVRTILNHYISERQDIVENTRSEVEWVQTEVTRERAINIDALNKRTLKKWSRWAAVMALQDFLIKYWYLDATRSSWRTNVDGKFWTDTENALKEYQRTEVFTSGFADWILTKWWKTVRSIIEKEGITGSPRYVADRQATRQEVVEAAQESNVSIDGLINTLQNSRDFYAYLEWREDGWNRDDILSDTWSLLGWVREIVWANEASSYFDEMRAFKEKLEDPEMQDRFNEGYLALIWNDWEEDYTVRTKSLGLYAARDVLIVLFAWIPMLDVRLNFMKSIVDDTWVGMDRAYVFSEWVKSWMEKPFEEYERTEWQNIETGKDTLINLQALKWTITAYISSEYKLNPNQIDNELITVLSETDNKIRDLINAYIDNRFIPDAETLFLGWFNFFERHGFDDKADNVENLLERLQWNRYMLDIKARRDVYVFDDVATEWTQDVYFFKNNGKYYLEIEWDYKEFTSLPTWTEIEDAVNEYSKWEDEARADGWKYMSIDEDENEAITLDTPEQRLWMANSIISLFREQNEEGWWPFNEWNLTNSLSNVEYRQNFFSEVAEKSEFLRASILVMKLREPSFADSFGKLKFFNSIDDFVNAFVMPDYVRNQLLSLKAYETSIGSFVGKLLLLTRDSQVKDFFTSLDSSEALTSYRLRTMDTVQAEHQIDVWDYKYWVRMLTKEEFRTLSDQELTAKYPRNFPGTFREVHGFDKPNSYDEYVRILLTKTGPEGSEWYNVNTLHERWLIEAWILDVSSDELLEAMTSDRFRAMPIAEFNGQAVINTARNLGAQHDGYETFINLQQERWDTHVFHTTVEKSYSFTTEEGNNTTQTVIYDVYLRPECENLLIVPNSKSVEQIVNNTELNMTVSRLNTPTLPLWILWDGLLARDRGNGWVDQSWGESIDTTWNTWWTTTIPWQSWSTWWATWGFTPGG